MSETRPDPEVPNWHIRLRRVMMEYFDDDELETLCFDLRVDYDELEGETKSQRIVSLITYLARTGRIDELITLCSEMRPNVPWDELRSAAQRSPLIVDDRSSAAEAWSVSTRSAPGTGVTPVSRSDGPTLSTSLKSPWVIAAIIGTGLLLVVLWTGRPGAAPGVVRVSPEPDIASSPSPTEAGIARRPTVGPGVLLADDFESSPTEAWRGDSNFPNPVVVRLPDGNHALQLRNHAEALYRPSWAWDTSDYRVEADVMVADLPPGTSIGWNVRIVSDNPVGYCQGYRAEIGEDYVAMHRVEAPGNNCDSAWEYTALNNGEFVLDAGTWHRLRIDVEGNRFRFYIDDRLTLTATDEANRYPEGGVGLIVFESQEAYVDNVVVTALAP